MCNVEITFDGLMVFCFPDSRQHGEVGLLTKDNDHEFKIEVNSKLVEDCPSDHSELRQLPPLYLFVEDSINGAWQGYREPEANSVRVDQSFDSVLDLNGEDFYGNGARIAADHYLPSLFISSGEFSVEPDHLSDPKVTSFFRVTEDVIKRIKDHRVPKDWNSLAVESKKTLTPFATRITFTTQLDETQRLVLSIDKDGRRILELPHRDAPYNIEIFNDDKEPVNTFENCKSFRFHSETILEQSAEGAGPLPRYSLVPLDKAGEENGEVARTSGACCISCKASAIKSLPNTSPQP